MFGSSIVWKASRRKGGPSISIEAASRPRLSLGAVGRTFWGTYRSAFLIQVRGYTLTGWAIATIISPIFLLASAWVLSEFIAPGVVPARFAALTGYSSYVAFAALGLAFNGLALSALDDGGSAVYDEERQGTWDLLAVAPFSRFTWMYAKTLAGLVSSFVDFIAVLVVGSFFVDFIVTPRTFAVAFVGVLLTIIGLQGFGFLMAALGLYWKQPHAVAVLLSPVIIFVSGMIIPVAALPESLQVVANGFPLTHGIAIVREALLSGRGFAELVPLFVRLVLTGAAFMAVGFSAFKIIEKRALRSGALGRY